MCNARIKLQLTFARCQAERVEGCLGRGEQEVILILVLDHWQVAAAVRADFGGVAISVSVFRACDQAAMRQHATKLHISGWRCLLRVII